MIKQNVSTLSTVKIKQKAQLMLTNRRYALRGQSRSPNMVSFDMLGMVSYYCLIVTLSVRRAVFSRYSTSKMPWPWNPVRGHSRSSKLVPFNRLVMVSYECSIETLFVIHTVLRYSPTKNTMTLLGVTEGHWKWHYLITTYDFLLMFHIVTMALCRAFSEIFDVEKYRDLEIPVKGQS